MLGVESFMASTAELRTVQLGGGGESTITEALNPHGGTLPLLTQPAIAEATCHKRESLPLQRRATITTAKAFSKTLFHHQNSFILSNLRRGFPPVLTVK